MPRWLRRRSAEQNYKRLRIERALEAVRRYYERRLLERAKRMLVERLVESYEELHENLEKARKLIEEAKRKGARHIYLHAIREGIIRSAIDDEVLKLVEQQRRLMAMYIAMMKTLEVDYHVHKDRIELDVKNTFLERIGVTPELYRQIVAVLRTAALARKVFSFIRNPTIRTLNQMFLAYERAKQVINLPPLSHLIYHDVCYADRDLVRFDGILPSRIYVATSTLKTTLNVIATFGLFATMLALVGNVIQKPDGHWITNAFVANDYATSMNDRVAIARTDDNRYVVAYPLWFAIYRPDRIERWKAKQLGRRELADYTVHCSVYREPLASRKAWAPRYSFRASRIRRISVRVPLRFWGAT